MKYIILLFLALLLPGLLVHYQSSRSSNCANFDGQNACQGNQTEND